METHPQRRTVCLAAARISRNQQSQFYIHFDICQSIAPFFLNFILIKMIYSPVRFVFLVVMINFIAAMQTKFMESSLFKLREDFKVGKQVPESAYHEVVFAVKQQNLDQLEKLFYEVSDPKNPKFGQFLSRHEVAALTSNKPSAEALTNFLLSHGATITRQSKHGEYISARAKVGVWENLFATKFFEFQHENAKTKPVVRALEYSLPVELAEHVEGVFNTVQLPPRNAGKIPATLRGQLRGAGSVTPALLNSYYHIFNNTGNNLASQSLFESLGQYYSPNDLNQFEKAYGVPQQDVAYDIGGFVSDEECVKDSNNCAEANLDVQYLIAVSQKTPTTYWYEDAADSFLAWIQAVADTENPPLVHSISYGAIEPELPKFIANQFNTEAQKLGVQGVSILVSSGDDGVANFQARDDPKKCGYNPSFPASSPYVTAVGATMGPESGTAEISCTSDAGGVITTGGGFSTIFSAPAYQKTAVSNYFSGLSTSQQPATGYNANGRGYPDVSMAGFNYEVIIGGKQYALSGTSASAPVVAGFVSLVNAARLQAGKKPLGFLNQAIYQNGVQFSNDVTTGENNCVAGRGEISCCSQGFWATSQWDPVTGFGSVDYKKFYDVFYNL
jgi:tripeptidyl-peptidase-1